MKFNTSIVKDVKYEYFMPAWPGYQVPAKKDLATKRPGYTVQDGGALRRNKHFIREIP